MRTVVFDTNAVIAALAGRLRHLPPTGDVAISVITEMELLCYTRATEDERREVERLIAEVRVIPLDGPVKDEAIALRRRFRLKLPDAIVAATAKCLDAQLVTLDQDFDRVGGLKTINPLREENPDDAKL